MAVTLGDRRVLVPQEGRDRVSNDITSTENDGIGSGDRDSGRLEKADDCGRSAGGEQRRRRARRKVTNIIGVEAGRDKRASEADREGNITHQHPFRGKWTR